MNGQLWQYLTDTFWWVGSASLDGALMIALVATLSWFLRERVAPQRIYLLWVTVWVGLFIPGFLEWTITLPVEDAPSFIAQGTSSAGVGGVVHDAPHSHPDTAPSVHGEHYHDQAPTLEYDHTLATIHDQNHYLLDDLVGLLPLLWLTGVVLLSLRIGIATVLWSRHVAGLHRIEDPKLAAIYSEAGATLGLRTFPALRSSGDLHSPAVTGFPCPTVILPEALVKEGDAATLRYVFLHELAHVKRGDYRLNAVLNGLLVLHWFNPLLYYAIREIRTMQEHLCDGLVLRAVGQEKAGDYGNLLLDLFQSARCTPPALALVPMFSTKPQLTRRIAMIANGQLTKKATWPSFALFFALLMVATVKISVATPEGVVHPIAIETYPPNYPSGIFREGDSITIKEVVGTRAEFVAGGTYTIRGTYTLQSEPAARLSFFATGGALREGKDNTILAARGAGDFEVTGTLDKTGAPHISYYPPLGGEGFGGVYFREATDRPAPTAVTHSIPFREATPSWGLDQSTSGNAITIEKVTGSRTHIEEGGVYTVEGRYTLATADRAQLIFYTTDGETEAISYEEPGGIFIEKGSGTFRLTGRIAKAGAPHISMYPIKQGQGFFNRYIVEEGAVDVPHYLTVAE